MGYEGASLPISKNDRVFSRLLVKERYIDLLPESKRREVFDALGREFKNGQFDEGLLKVTSLLDGAWRKPRLSPVSDGWFLKCRRPGEGEAHGAKFGLGTLLFIGLGIFGVLLLIRVLSGAFGRRGGYSSPMGMGGMPRQEWGRVTDLAMDPGMVADMGRLAVDSSPACSEAWAELWPATGFTTSSRGATAAMAMTMPRPTPVPRGPTSADQGGDDFVGGNDDGGQGGTWADSGGDAVAATGVADTGGGNWGGGGGGGDWGGGGGGDGGGW